jgi:hypothetical protein
VLRSKCGADIYVLVGGGGGGGGGGAAASDAAGAVKWVQLSLINGDHYTRQMPLRAPALAAMELLRDPEGNATLACGHSSGTLLPSGHVLLPLQVPGSCTSVWRPQQPPPAH